MADEEQQSYTAMSVGDVQAIGSRCQAAFCGQLDFLPFKCESCKGTFCLDHRTETAHACSKAGEWARQRQQRNQGVSSSTSTLGRKPNILTHEAQCSSPSCKTLINTALTPGIQCDTCNRSYCLKHRMREDHDCANLKPIGAVPRSDGGKADALSKLRAWGAAKKAQVQASTQPSLSKTKTSESSNSTTSQTLQRIITPFLSSSRTKKPQSSNVVALNSLKRNAKGDAKIPNDKRIYVHLEAVRSGSEGSAGAKVPSADAFYSNEWTVGKVLDAAAKTLQISNVNNTVSDETMRLRVFHIEGGRVLEFSEKLGKNVSSGDTLVLLRGIGAPPA